jgi:hypothetical protein
MDVQVSLEVSPMHIFLPQFLYESPVFPKILHAPPIAYDGSIMCLLQFKARNTSAFALCLGWGGYLYSWQTIAVKRNI